MTQLRAVVVSGFRAFTNEATFDLDADVLLLAGPNGSGKTSFFDAILWALSGALPRFADRKADVVSLYAPGAHARVELVLDDNTGKPVTVVRSLTRGEDPKVSVTSTTEQLEGPSAETYILQRFWPAALQTQDSRAAFCTAFTRSVYLQQDLVRQFIESDTDETRFAVLSELVGAARLAEFLRSLESSRNAWSRTRTDHERSLLEAQTRVREIEERLTRLQDAGDIADVAGRWSTWWNKVGELRLELTPPAFGSVEASQTLSEALSVLQADRRAIERRHRDAASLLNDRTARITRTDEPRPPLEELRATQAAIAADLEVKKQQLASAQEAAKQALEHLTEQREKGAELRSLATLALRHADGDTCPVCGQPHNAENTRHRLETLLQRPDETPAQGPEPLTELAGQVAAAESRLADSVLEIRRAEREATEQQEWEADLRRRLAEFQLEPNSTPAQLDALLITLNDREQLLADLFSQGEQLALLIARSAEAAQRSELQQQLAAARHSLEQRRELLDSHERAGALANEILEAGRSATREAVDARMQGIEPLVERIYARMDPHPAFTKIRLGTSYPRGRGRVQAFVADPTAGLENKDPYTLFSSSQLNALAVSIFLGLNLGAAEAPLAVAMLDDPLQSLDDVNLLGLVDTFRRTKALRQLIVSTHDRRLASLLERKLRPVGDDRATRVYNFEGWTPEDGPSLMRTEVASEPEELRVAAA
jgi:DNA repair exonuclease SbcCD ATPase subunit